tara:strand:+ start:93 stop:464 length:372 start_codon:yes stop_codon:yes gene_type:complete
MADEQIQDPTSAYLADFGTRLNEVEEKQRLQKNRTLLIGENLISTKEDFIKLDSQLKKQLNQMRSEIDSIKQLMTRIVNEMSNFARKSEIEILERQMKMFQPLEVARIKDVKKIVREEIKKGS